MVKVNKMIKWVFLLLMEWIPIRLVIENTGVLTKSLFDFQLKPIGEILPTLSLAKTIKSDKLR